jgi:hypothetical protein
MFCRHYVVTFELETSKLNDGRSVMFLQNLLLLEVTLQIISLHVCDSQQDGNAIVMIHRKSID